MIEAVSALAATLAELQSLGSAAGAAGPSLPDLGPAAAHTTHASFAASLRDALSRADDAVASANAAAKAFAAGNHDIPLSDVMVSLEQANLAMQLAATVRDKVAAAYTSIMNMPV
jgi:flagellar hook-basal body complex protein FliE